MNAESLALESILTITDGTHHVSLRSGGREEQHSPDEASCPELHGHLIPSLHALLWGSQLPAKGGWRARIRAGEVPSKVFERDFPGGAVVKNPSANAGDVGSRPGPGRSHMPRSNKARVPQLLNLRSRAREPQLLSLHATTTEARVPRARAPQQEKPLQ